MNTIVNEGHIRLKIPKAAKISKSMGVFYNPAMGLSRDISVLLLNSLNRGNMQIADPLAATGVRSIRFLKELNKNKIKKNLINDNSKDAIKLIKENFALNNIQCKNNKKIQITCQDANLFLLNSAGFDYIDIDPFGSPNFLLDCACKRIARNGILAVTATDTSALCGTFPKACLRKYWAIPRRDAVMHETGLRILIRKIQLIAAQYEKALIPIFSYSKEHYMRAFLKNEKGKNNVDNILKQHGLFNEAGPMWLGNLWDKSLAEKMHKNAVSSKIFKNNKELIKLLKTIKEESKINAVGFSEINLQKKCSIIDKIKKRGYSASETHFNGQGIRSGIPASKLARLLENK
ncbi:hypothetical protein HYY71_06450 [Candidatus Woesearchaeota archaeon]|nr:hypothetical protein [Candidatus Woesearchaeota archaeon]